MDQSKSNTADIDLSLKYVWGKFECPKDKGNSWIMVFVWLITVIESQLVGNL